jgi:type 1 glutamine amidotransferase
MGMHHMSRISSTPECSSLHTRLSSFLNRVICRTIAGIGIFTLIMGSISQAADEAPEPLRALLITGGCCHDYTQQKSILAEGISARAHVKWTIVQDPSSGTKGRPSVYYEENWAKNYDVVVHNECFSDEKEIPWLERIVDQHRQGVPAVVIHCAMHCYRAPTNTWFKFCGVRSHGHGPHFAYEMKNQKPDHPIMKGFPAIWQTPREELYNISEVYPDATPLATGYSPQTKKDEVNLWINQFGKARVFGTTVGHYNHTMEEPIYLDVVTRGLLWACDKLNDDGTPAKGYGPPAEK